MCAVLDGYLKATQCIHNAQRVGGRREGLGMSIGPTSHFCPRDLYSNAPTVSEFRDQFHMGLPHV